MAVPKYGEVPAPMPAAEASEPNLRREREVIIIGGGIAGLSAAIYLGRALRDVLVIDAGESLAQWEPEVQNYLGFPESVDGCELLKRGRQQALRFGAQFLKEEIERASGDGSKFDLQGKKGNFTAQSVLLATGVYHLPPKIPGVNECVGKSMFFCKDCDGYRIKGKTVAIVGHNNEAAEYGLGILNFTRFVTLLTNGEPPCWSAQHARWLNEYGLSVVRNPIADVTHDKGYLSRIHLCSGKNLEVDALFTTRGDLYHNGLAHQLGAEVNAGGEVMVDSCQRTNIEGLYAAGCVTPANCQMIIAAGAGARAAQAINRDLFEKELAAHKLRRRTSEAGTVERGPAGSASS